MDLIILALGIIAAFGAGAVGSAAVILINDKRMAAVEKVKRRILYGPERPLIPVPPGLLMPDIFDKMFEQALGAGQIIKIKEESTAKEIEMKQRAAAVSPLNSKKHIDDILNMTQKEFEAWRRANN